MRQNEKDELRALLMEIAECAKENAQADSPKSRSLPLKDSIAATYQLLGCIVIILALVAFLLSMRGDITANTATVTALRADAMSRDARIRDLELESAKRGK